MERKIKLHCKKEEELDLYFAEVTYEQCFTCGQGYGKTKEEAIVEACSNALPYVKARYGEKVLFEACLRVSSDEAERVPELEQRIKELEEDNKRLRRNNEPYRPEDDPYTQG